MHTNTHRLKCTTVVVVVVGGGCSSVNVQYTPPHTPTIAQEGTFTRVVALYTFSSYYLQRVCFRKHLMSVRLLLLFRYYASTGSSCSLDHATYALITSPTATLRFAT